MQEKNHVKVSRQTKKHLRTVAHSYTRKKIQTLHSNEACQTSTHVECVLKCDGTCAETIFRISVKRRSPFKSAVASVQSTTGSRVVRISGSNA